MKLTWIEKDGRHNGYSHGYLLGGVIEWKRPIAWTGFLPKSNRSEHTYPQSIEAGKRWVEKEAGLFRLAIKRNVK